MLTQKEITILNALTNGSSNHEISRRCDISVNTVKYHLKKIYRKIGVRNRTEATLKSITMLNNKNLLL